MIHHLAWGELTGDPGDGNFYITISAF
jgi:hypothetical protein